jgi:hypothetical protein
MAVSFALELEEAVGVVSPFLTSLRYSMWGGGDDDLGEGVLDDEEAVRLLPATLTHLDILPAPSVSVPAISASGANVTASLKDAAMMERLRSIAESFSCGEDKGGEGRLQFRLLDRDVVGGVEGGSGLRKEWQQWVDTGR